LDGGLGLVGHAVWAMMMLAEEMRLAGCNVQRAVTCGGWRRSHIGEAALLPRWR
jgi:hypothetical protein